MNNQEEMNQVTQQVCHDARPDLILPPVHSITFTLPMVPPSVNSLYSVNFKEPDPSRRITLKDECRLWKNSAAGYMPRFKVAPDSVIRVDRTYWFNWFTKTGKWAKKDAFNFDKLLFDMISKRINVDDSRFKEGMMRSINSPVEKTLVCLTEVPISVWSAYAQETI